MFSRHQQASGWVLDPDRSHGMATLHAASRSLRGSPRLKGVWVPGLGDLRRWLQKAGLCSSPALCFRLPPHAAPTPAIPDPSCTACATLGCAAPSSPQFPVAGGQLGLWRVRVWCCSAICGRSGNNLKLNPQLFGSLLWNHCKFINNSCGHTWPGSQPQPHPPNCRREAAVDLQFSVTFLRGEKLHEEKSPPSLHGHRKLAVGEWATSPGDQKCWRKQAQKAVKKLHKNSHVLSAQTSILGTFRLRLATVVNVWLVETSFSPWTICSFSSFIFSCPDPATWAELCGFVV